MQIGSLVIANDLLGFKIGEDSKYTHIQDKEGNIRKVYTNQVHEVVDPIKLLYMSERKLCKIKD